MVALRLRALIVILAAGLAAPLAADAAVIQLTGPGDFITPNSVANYDAWPDQTVANNLYSAQGLTLSLPGGGNMPVYDWAAIGRVTTSNPNVVAAVSGPGFTFSTAI